jgi:hypothetical protein
LRADRGDHSRHTSRSGSRELIVSTTITIASSLFPEA